MKKKTGVWVLVLAVLIGLGIFFLMPSPIIPDENLCTLHRVIYRSGNEEIDMTAHVDLDHLEGMLATYHRARVPTGFAPYPRSDVTVEIDGISGGKPIHILLGKINLVYESANRGGYQIRNGAALWNEVYAMVAVS